MTDSDYSTPSYKSSGKNCSNRIIRFISPVPANECVVQVHNNINKNNSNNRHLQPHRHRSAEYSKNRSANYNAKMKVLMRADTHKHINVIKEEGEDQKEYKVNASQVSIFFILLFFLELLLLLLVEFCKFQFVLYKAFSSGCSTYEFKFLEF